MPSKTFCRRWAAVSIERVRVTPSFVTCTDGLGWRMHLGERYPSEAAQVSLVTFNPALAIGSVPDISSWVHTDKQLFILPHPSAQLVFLVDCAALVAQQAAQAATVAASPFSWAFQLVWLGSHLCLVALVGSACLTLAVLPVWETLAAGRVRDNIPLRRPLGGEQHCAVRDFCAVLHSVLYTMTCSRRLGSNAA